jgi:ABC-type multidrug transport system fused ATPase/permease subunit
LFETIKNIFFLSPSLKKLLIQAIVFVLIIEAAKLIPPYLVKNIVDILLVSNNTFVPVIYLVLGILITSVITSLIESKYYRFNADVGFKTETEILKSAHSKVLDLDLSYHENHPSGDTVHLINNGALKLKELLWFIQDQFLASIIQVVLSSILLLYTHTYAALFFVASLPISIFLIVISAKKLQPYRRSYHRLFREASWNMTQSIVHSRTVKDFVQETAEKKLFSSGLDKYLSGARERITVEADDMRIRDWLLGLIRSSVIMFAAYLVYQGEMTAGTLVLFSTVSEKAIASLYRIGRLFSFLGDSIEAINQLIELYNVKNKIVEDNSSLALAKGNAKGEVIFQDVSFGYNSNSNIINQFSLVIPKRSICAFVGRSGAGKSTLVKLLFRHYDVSSGKILLDNHDIRDIRLNDYRAALAVVSQDVEIFDRTIYENISYGIDATLQDVINVAKRAYAHSFIEKLPQGYNTKVGERGVLLSGGQKQRLGIARALLKNPLILVFDEATSSLDSESEQMIQQAIKGISRELTLIVIAHRLSTIQSADMIVVMDEGKLIEIGTHKELLSKRGLFQYLRELQGFQDLDNIDNSLPSC